MRKLSFEKKVFCDIKEWTERERSQRKTEKKKKMMRMKNLFKMKEEFEKKRKRRKKGKKYFVEKEILMTKPPESFQKN